MGTLLTESYQVLHGQGGRMTPQRRLILETLDKLSCHPTAEELYEILQPQDPSLHLSTIYRTLRWLEDEGLCSPRFFDPAARRERFDPTHGGEHYHFLCRNCKQIIEFDNLLVNTIKAQFELHSGASVESGTVMLTGLCARCRKESH